MTSSKSPEIREGGQPSALGVRLPDMRKITVDDVNDAFQKGLADFKAQPWIGVFFGGAFTLGGWFILYMLLEANQPWWILPIAFGFPLIGPFAAVGLYEVSRRLSAGEPIVWSEIIGVVFQQRRRQLPWMAFIVLLIFWLWLYQVRLVTALFIGLSGFSTLSSFWEFLFTPAGILFLVAGSAVGAVLALGLFSVTVMAIPMLLDREIDFMTAVITSLKVVADNAVVMLGWGVAVTCLAMLGIATWFVGLAFIFPILGHTTWHLYRHAIVAESGTATAT